MECIETDVTIIGAGVVGLAAAAQVPPGATALLLEKHSKFGQETSSRNSEVVHSGIYYPVDAKKTALCIRGRDALYALCQSVGIPFSKVGKFVVATEADDEAYLQTLANHCARLSVPHQWISARELARQEPHVRARAALLFPETGIVDSHRLMDYFERAASNQGVQISYRTRCEKISRSGDGWRIAAQAADGSSFEIQTRAIVNCAGLAAARLTREALGIGKYEHRFCRGRYFTLSALWRGRFQHLIYPVPPKDGLGIHVTVDLAGAARLGPDVDWCDAHVLEPDIQHYDCDWDTLRPSFWASAARYAPTIAQHELEPGMIGIRPKLFVDGQPHRDFVIEEENGFISCLGIESPGLTSAIAIAEVITQHLRSVL